MIFTKEGILLPKKPFDFEKTLTFINGFPPSIEEQEVKSQTLKKATIIGDEIIVFELKSRGNIESPHLFYRLYSQNNLSSDVETKTINRITSFLSLQDDLSAFYEKSKEDDLFYPIVQQLYGYHQVKFLTPFENACWAILSQRTPVPLARAMKFQLAKEFGRTLEVEGTTYIAFPEPQHLLHTSEIKVQELLNNSCKTNYILSVAEAFASVSDEFIYTSEYNEVFEFLKGIHGIGDWSASFIMLRGIGRMEKLPVGEKMLKKNK